MDKRPLRKFQLCAERIETLDDIKKILKVMNIRIDTEHPLFDTVEEYFAVEVIPRGYIKLLEKVGYEGIANMSWDEMEIEASKLLNDSDDEETL